MLSRKARGRFAPFVVAVGLLGLAGVLVGFTAYALILGEDARGFGLAVLVSGVGGGLLWLLGTRRAQPSKREALSAVLLLWLLLPLVGALPYAVSSDMTPLNALFESMSGFTASGATALRDFSSFSKSLFMWRALTQWFGGIGIIVLFIAVLPQLAIAGQQLFFAEAPGPTEEKLTPTLRQTSNALLSLYVGLTAACALAYFVFGMDPYNALAHALTTAAAAGFSPNALSFEGFSPALSWVATIFMLLAGANFALLYQAVTGRPRNLLRDSEFRVYVSIAIGAALIMSIGLLTIYGPGDALRHGFFQSLSILTTTGYASADFADWPREVQVILVVLMFIGGSAGSASGGVKVVRWLMLAKNMGREVRSALHPRGVFPVRIDGRTVPPNVLRAVAGFFTLYVFLFVFTVVVLVLFGADFLTAFTASIACLGNVGPGLGGVGPMLSFADLHPVSRGLLIFDLYAGRLEVVPVFVLLNVDWWRLPRRWQVGRRS